VGRLCLNGRAVRSSLLSMAAAAVFLTASQASWADVADLEKDLQASLEQSRRQVSLAARKLEAGIDASPEIARIRTLAENIRITNLLLEERFKLREEKARSLGSEVLSRQQAMAEGYRKAIQEYLEIVESLPAAGSGQQSADNNPQSAICNHFLRSLSPKRNAPSSAASRTST